MKRISKEQVVLEEVIEAAIVAGRAAAERYARDPAELSGVMAYLDIIDVAQEQAELIGLQFANASLATFDPEQEFFGRRKAA